MKSLKSWAWLTALVLLCGALVFFNLPEGGSAESKPQSHGTPSFDDGVPFGSEPGQRVEDFTLPTVYGGEWKLSDHWGKVTVINLWATWCTPCVNELPYFESVFQEFGDGIGLLAIHSNLITDDVKAYLDKKDYTLPFAVDEEGTAIQKLGGSTMLPQTVILDAKGIVTYNKVGSVTEEKLRALIEQAKQQSAE